MKADILTLETAKKIADLERDVLYYKETRDELIESNVRLREDKIKLLKILDDLEKWLKIHSIVDYNCSNEIVHEQLALNIAYEYLKELKGE